MWFSSGGTKSVLHTDQYDNLNCVVRGEKIFVMADFQENREKVNINFFTNLVNLIVYDRKKNEIALCVNPKEKFILLAQKQRQGPLF